EARIGEPGHRQHDQCREQQREQPRERQRPVEKAPLPCERRRSAPGVRQRGQLPNSAVYRFLISATCGSIATGSSGSILICASGVLLAGSFTSGCTERVPPVSTASCCVFAVYRKFW